MTRSTAENSFVLRDGAHLHLVGIGGSGISSIARVLLDRGFVISGSDVQENSLTKDLSAAGASIMIGHRAENIVGAEMLIVSSAIPTSNPETMSARLAGVPIFKRDEFLGQLMAGSVGIAVAGSHGKTTTAGMIAHILLETGNDPSVILGGILPEWGTNGRAGKGDYFVIEADEYDHMFLGLRPELAVITNIEHDHPDIFHTEAVYMDAFKQFVELLPVDGGLVACAEDSGVSSLLQAIDLPDVEITTYGLQKSHSLSAFDFEAVDTRSNHLGGTDFLVQNNNEVLGLARLRVPGDHNVRNALAAIIVALDLEIEFTDICRALAAFGGMGRRFQVIGEAGGVTIVDDYAHHPTEIRATLSAARQRYQGRRLWAVWQPHTFSRTKLMQSQFAQSFVDADRVIALDIYRSRETDTLGMSTDLIIDAMEHQDAVYIPKFEEAVAYLLDRIHQDDVVLTLGAGDGNVVGSMLFKALQERVRSFRP